MRSPALDQYLKIATGNNVYAEQSFNVSLGLNRWRLVCDKCGQTLTFAENYDLADDYANKGRLDTQVQEFAKAHLHLTPTGDVAKKTVTYDFDDKPMQIGGMNEQLKKWAAEKIAAEESKQQKFKQKYLYEDELELQKLKNKIAIEELKSKMKQFDYGDFEKLIKPEPVKAAPTPRKTEGRRFR